MAKWSLNLSSLTSAVLPLRRPVADEILPVISLIVSHFQSQRISGPDIPLVGCHMQLEVPLSFVLGSSHCQSWGDIFQIGFLQLVPFLLDKFFLPGHSFFHSFLLRNTLL